MLTVTLTTQFDTTRVELRANEHHVATYPISRDDGPGPIPAAEAVLATNGWQITGEWHHEAGGITGDVWMTTAEQAQATTAAENGA